MVFTKSRKTELTARIVHRIVQPEDRVNTTLVTGELLGRYHDDA